MSTIFDFIVIAINISELFLSSGGVFTALRAMRLFRVVRLLRRWKSFQSILTTIRRSLKEILMLTVLLVFWIFLFAILGMQLFAGAFGTGSAVPRSNFDNLWMSFLTVFQVRKF